MVKVDGRNLGCGVPDGSEETDGVVNEGSNTVSEDTQMTNVTQENSDQIVDKVLGWLKSDLSTNPVRFFGENPVTYDGERINPEDLVGFIDDRFFMACKKVVRTAVEARLMMGFADGCGNDMTTFMIQDACVVVVYELFRTMFFHHGHKRGTGDDYFYSHLIGEVDENEPGNVKKMGATLILMKLLGLCGLSSIVGTFKHDDKEDVDGMTDYKLLDVSLYMHRFEDVDPDKICRFIKGVVALVSGVTKVSDVIDQAILETHFGVKFENYKEATFYQFLVQMEKDIRVAFVKFADRLHNMLTIMGHSDEEKRKKIARETIEIYLPLARLLKVEELVKELIDVCVQVLNPDLYDEFYSFSRNRTAEIDEKCPFIDGEPTCREAILVDIGKCLGITDPKILSESVKFSNFRLEHYTQYFSSGLDTLKFSDFGINRIDPMQEIVVLVDDPSQIYSVSKDIEMALNLMSSGRVSLLHAPSSDSPTHWLRPDGTAVVNDISAKGDSSSGSYLSSFVQRGVLITGFSSVYRRQLKIRVNDKKSEYRKRRGIQANADKSKAPDDLLADIRYLIRLKAERPQDNVLQESRSHLLGPRTCFYTPHGDLRIIPAGACFAEAAFSVHSACGITIDNANISRSLNDGQGTLVGNVLDPVPFVVLGEHDVPMIFFNSTTIAPEDLRNNTGMLSAVDACPGWLVFFKDRKAIGKLKLFLKKPYEFFGVESLASQGDLVTCSLGKRYIDRLIYMFGENFVQTYFRNLEERSRSLRFDFVRQVGLGELDIFSDIVDSMAFENTLYVEAGVSSEDHRYFSSVIEEAGFSSKYINEKRGKNGCARRFYTVSIQNGSDPYYLCKALLRLSYVFDLSIKRGISLKESDQSKDI